VLVLLVVLGWLVTGFRERIVLPEPFEREDRVAVSRWWRPPTAESARRLSGALSR